MFFWGSFTQPLTYLSQKRKRSACIFIVVDEVESSSQTDGNISSSITIFWCISNQDNTKPSE